MIDGIFPLRAVGYLEEGMGGKHPMDGGGCHGVM